MLLLYSAPTIQTCEGRLRRAQFERPPLLEALKERKERMESEPRYNMNQSGLLCDEPWCDLRHFSFVTSYITCTTLHRPRCQLHCMRYGAWATLSATLHGLRCDMLRACATLHGLRCQLRCMGYVVTCYVIWATLHGLRWQLHCIGYVAWATLAATLHGLHCMGYVAWATWIRKNPSQSFREKGLSRACS